MGLHLVHMIVYPISSLFSTFLIYILSLSFFLPNIWQYHVGSKQSKLNYFRRKAEPTQANFNRQAMGSTLFLPACWARRSVLFFLVFIMNWKTYGRSRTAGSTSPIQKQNGSSTASTQEPFFFLWIQLQQKLLQESFLEPTKLTLII